MKDAIKALKTSPEGLFVLGYMLFPLFALIFAGLGLFMVLTGSKIMGLVLLLVFTQIFAFGSLKLVGMRKALLAGQGEKPGK
ncbi:NF038396 family protein [Paeniglutamicibacter sp. Y32M11]|uniref:NF038396 family protein n=1 Tax=Paeniglutamicibacter sp. Y32M11 TaxID=2853258 RepID=UPI001048FD35|nr:NF038396 family protein [Paeniglutamicibacter sp. Y32M11]QXQ09318.1 NF038396 family protein [Paeniglutamicibacter sp. Y32M11]